MPDAQAAADKRLMLTFCIALTGIGTMLVAFIVAVLAFQGHAGAGQTIAAVLGPLSAVVGTLVGYVAGQTAGSAAKEAAEGRASNAQDKLTAILAESPQGLMDQVRAKNPNLFA